MKVHLAGYNVDADVLEKIKNDPYSTEEILSGEALTPETIVAADARISRSEDSIDTLRDTSRRKLGKSRESNETIIHGMGHDAVAEHGTFNFDIKDITRYSVEWIQRSRRPGYTEKSQRYVLFMGDFLIPKEIKKIGFEKQFTKRVNSQNQLYFEFYKNLKPWFLNNEQKRKEAYELAVRDGAKDPEKKRDSTLDGWAKEDARFILPMATYTQMGATFNANDLQKLIRRLNSLELNEAGELAKELYIEARKIAPSLINEEYSAPTSFSKRKKGKPLRDYLEERKIGLKKPKSRIPHFELGDVTLLSYNPKGDDLVLAGLLHREYENLSALEIMSLIEGGIFDSNTKKELIKESLRGMQSFEVPPRPFEDLILCYEVKISSSGFAQLKRHRPLLEEVQDYNPELGNVIPESVKETGMENKFKEEIYKTNELFYKIQQFHPKAATYILTNSHKRRVKVTPNARELYHIAHLRMDHHAQWEIRRLANEMGELAKQVNPSTFILLTGKDTHQEVYDSFFKNER